MVSYLLANFGGPRNLEEIPSFLTELLCDRDLIWTKFPSFFHNWLFSRIARKRAKKVREDYMGIGSRSPIYFDTEKLKVALEEKLQAPVYTFHRYLSATHASSLKHIEREKEMIVLPLFPQFCFATTGSVARFLSRYPLRWVKSYANHPAFIAAYQRKLAEFLKAQNLKEREAFFLFSAHGVPQAFIDKRDPYQSECESSFCKVMQGFPKAKGLLCYQSKFGKGEWIKPYTNEVCEKILNYHEGRTSIVFVPISFTSDHIETLFEIEKLYLPVVEQKGLKAYRCPALNLEPYWIEALALIAKESFLNDGRCLIRKKPFG